MISTDCNLRLIEGSNESMVCHAIGTPNLRINWEMDGNIIPSDELDYNSIKQMSEADDDQMNLTCTAENQFGIDSRTVSFKLIGKMKMKIPLIMIGKIVGNFF